MSEIILLFCLLSNNNFATFMGVKCGT